MPQRVGLLVLALDESDVLILLLDRLIEHLLLVLIVNDLLLIPTHPLLQLLLSQPHFGVGIRQEVLQPLVVELKLVELGFLILEHLQVVGLSTSVNVGFLVSLLLIKLLAMQLLVE